jgi:N6-adenosine-specific RNA methylase IME4
MINKKYQVIVIDPPWEIKKLTHKERPNQVNMDYPLMNLEQIKSLSIENISSDNSWCFLWTTQKYIFQAKEILENWGFKYLLLMTWKKLAGRSEGMPLFGFRWNSEFILVGYKGKIPLWVKGKPLIKTCFEGINIRHSQKPIEFYNAIKNLGDNRIDIFARDKKEGWDCWGNEVNSNIELLSQLEDDGGEK